MKKKKQQLRKTIEKALGGRDLVLVSNRGPVQFSCNDNGERTWQRGAGGLTTALHSVLTATNALWVAAAMTDEDRALARDPGPIGIPVNDPLYHLYFVDIPPKAYELYYNKISNKIFWFLQHYLFDPLNQPVFDDDFKTAWSRGYVNVNKRFAQTVAAITKDSQNPIIMIQDYHLYLAAFFLRQLKRDVCTFHFVHIPWCSPDYFRFLPGELRTSILRGLLANDIIGFHSWRYVRNFMHCCQEFLGLRIDLRKHKVYADHHTVYVKAYPISISVDELETHAACEEVAVEAAKIKELQAKYQLIVRIDRAEPSKNLLRGFDAYRRLLEKYPDFAGKVKFLAYAYPTRESLNEYQALREAVERKVRSINDRFGRDDWQPIDLSIEDNYHRSLAAMGCFDVLLTNPICDGMNLVAKESAALNSRDGVIVLSENAGAYEELRDGVLGINPFDIEDTMEKLRQALTMTPLERGLRSARLREIVEHNDVLKWLRHQLKDIQKISTARASQRAKEAGSPLEAEMVR